MLFLKALKVLDAIQASVSNYLVSFFGVPIAAIWLGERLTIPAIIGGLLVLVSTILMTLWDRGATPPVSAAAATGVEPAEPQPCLIVTAELRRGGGGKRERAKQDEKASGRHEWGPQGMMVRAGYHHDNVTAACGVAPVWLLAAFRTAMG